jgi:hypothetical protein
VSAAINHHHHRLPSNNNNNRENDEPVNTVTDVDTERGRERERERKRVEASWRATADTTTRRDDHGRGYRFLVFAIIFEEKRRR